MAVALLVARPFAPPRRRVASTPRRLVVAGLLAAAAAAAAAAVTAGDFVVTGTGPRLVGRAAQNARDNLVRRAAGSGAAAVRAEVDELERRALAAAEAWENDVTDFLEPEVAEAALERFARLADVAAVRSGGYAGAGRVRLVLSRQELVEATGEEDLAEEYSVLLRVTADLSNEDPLPNVLDGIGIPLSQVGDIISVGGSTYVVVAPEAVKPAMRLLKKALSGNVEVEVVEEEDFVPEGDRLEVKLKRLDSREQKKTR